MKYKITYQKDGKVEILKVNNLENLPNNIIKIEEKKIIINFQFRQQNKKDILDMFSQLSIMLNANLTFNEAIDLSLKTEQSDHIKEILTLIKSSITSGKPIDQALQKYEQLLGNLAILFLKLGMENGNIKQSLTSLTQLLQEDINTKRKLNDALRYPKLLVVSLLLSLGIIFLFVIPNFEYIFTMSQNEIPVSTQILIGINNLIKNYAYVVVILLLSLTILSYGVYKKFIFTFHKFIVLNVPIINRVLKDYYFYRLFLLISIIVNSKYQFQIAIENSKNLIPNLYIKKLIHGITFDIKNGISISKAFEKTKLFDHLTIKLLSTAEHTTQYETILQDIAIYYKNKFQMSLKVFSSYIEPLIIMCIAMVVLWLMLAIMLPIWNMNTFLS
jgi:type II secretory pathway component PulF